MFASGDLGFVIIVVVVRVGVLIFGAIKWCCGVRELRFVGVLRFVALLDFAGDCFCGLIVLNWLFILFTFTGFEVVLLDLCVSVMVVSCFCWFTF